MVLVICWEVGGRYLAGAPTIWAYDTALIIYAWIGMLGGAFALRHDTHIRVDILTARLTPRRKAVLELITAPLIAFFLGLVLWQTAGGSWHAVAVGANRPTEWAPPLVLFLITVPIGAALLLLQASANWLRAFWLVATGRELAP
jgi:TRAP-type C4-dicarboxylate transport system permease small subunit